MVFVEVQYKAKYLPCMHACNLIAQQGILMLLIAKTIFASFRSMMSECVM